MLIFNTTYKVSTKENENWIIWIKEQHIPFMLASGNFAKPQITKIVGSEDDEGTSYSVQFHIADMHIEPIISYNTISRRSSTGIYGSNGRCTIGLSK